MADNYRWGEGQQGGKVTLGRVNQPNWAQKNVLPFLASALQKTQTDYETQKKMELQKQQSDAEMARYMAYGAQQNTSAEKIAMTEQLQKMWDKAYTDDAIWANQWTDSKTGSIKPGAPMRPLMVFFNQVGPDNIRKMGLEGVYETLTHPPGAVASEKATKKVRPGSVTLTPITSGMDLGQMVATAGYNIPGMMWNLPGQVLPSINPMEGIMGNLGAMSTIVPGKPSNWRQNVPLSPFQQWIGSLGVNMPSPENVSPQVQRYMEERSRRP